MHTEILSLLATELQLFFSPLRLAVCFLSMTKKHKLQNYRLAPSRWLPHTLKHTHKLVQHPSRQKSSDLVQCRLCVQYYYYFIIERVEKPVVNSSSGHRQCEIYAFDRICSCIGVKRSVQRKLDAFAFYTRCWLDYCVRGGKHVWRERRRCIETHLKIVRIEFVRLLKRAQCWCVCVCWLSNGERTSHNILYTSEIQIYRVIGQVFFISCI